MPVKVGKRLLKSKTFWVNIGLALLKTLTALGIVNLPPGVEDLIVPALIGENAINIGLRAVTSEPVDRV